MGKSFPQAAEEALVPYFEKQAQRPLIFTDPRLALYNLLTPERQAYFRETLNFDTAHYIDLLRGAQMDFANSQLSDANGKIYSIPDNSNNDALAISMAAYDAGAGLLMDFSPLPYRAYFAPMTRTNLRAYTRLPGGIYSDKRYDDICSELETTRSPEFYFIVIDAAIRGKFDLAATLPSKQQELLVDLIAIAMAEHRLQFKKGNPYYRDSLSSTGPFYNLAIDSLLFNFGAWQLDENGVPMPGNCRYYLDGYGRKGFYNEKNARLYTRHIARAFPLAYTSLNIESHATLHETIAYFMAHPKRYDMAMRIQLRKIMMGMPKLAREMAKTISGQ